MLTTRQRGKQGAHAAGASTPWGCSTMAYHRSAPLGSRASARGLGGSGSGRSRLAQDPLWGQGSGCGQSTHAEQSKAKRTIACGAMHWPAVAGAPSAPEAVAEAIWPAKHTHTREQTSTSDAVEWRRRQGRLQSVDTGTSHDSTASNERTQRAQPSPWGAERWHAIAQAHWACVQALKDAEDGLGSGQKHQVAVLGAGLWLWAG